MGVQQRLEGCLETHFLKSCVYSYDPKKTDEPPLFLVLYAIIGFICYCMHNKRLLILKQLSYNYTVHEPVPDECTQRDVKKKKTVEIKPKIL